VYFGSTNFVCVVCSILQLVHNVQAMVMFMLPDCVSFIHFAIKSRGHTVDVLFEAFLSLHSESLLHTICIVSQ